MPELKTSFIPKRPLTQPESAGASSRRPVGIVMLIMLALFLLSLVLTGGLYFYKALLEQQVKSMSASVDRARTAIDPALIERVTRFDGRIDAAEQVIEKHRVVSPLFALLERLTLPTVRFEMFRFAVDERGKLILSLSGEAKSYSALALQADLFGEDASIKEPIFSNLRLNAEGNVSFDFSAVVNPPSLSFKELFAGRGASLPPAQPAEAAPAAEE